MPSKTLYKIITSYVILQFILLILNKSLFGQDYRQYHLSLVKAEQQISEEKYREASRTYDSIFSIFPQKYYVDLHNAFLCNLKTGNTNKAIEIARWLVLNGYSYNEFNQEGIKEIIHTPEWISFSNEYPQLYEKHNSILSPSKRNFIYTICRLDQFYSKDKPLAEQDSVFVINTSLIDSIFKADGIPDIFMKKDTLGFKLHSCLRHFFGMFNNGRYTSLPNKLEVKAKILYKSIDSTLRKGIISGLLPPETYLRITTYFQTSNLYGTLKCIIDFEREIVDIVKPDFSTFKTVNLNRTAIGIPEIDEALVDKYAFLFLPKYPFTEVKANLNSSEPKDRMELAIYLANVNGKIKELQTSTTKQSFILKKSMISLNDYYYSGLEKYYKWIKKDGINSK